MSTRCGKSKLRGLHQPRATRFTNLEFRPQLRHEPRGESRTYASAHSMARGLTASASVYPFWGSFKRFAKNLSASFPGARAGSSLLDAYAAVLAAIVAGLTVALISASHFGSVWAIAALCVLAAVAERSRVRLNPTIELSISLVPTLFAAVVFGPLAAMAVGASGMVLDLPVGARQRAYPHANLRWFIYTMSSTLIGACAAFAAEVVARQGRGQRCRPDACARCPCISAALCTGCCAARVHI
jgi:hypothetical protein